MALTQQQILEYRKKYNIQPLNAPTPATMSQNKDGFISDVKNSFQTRMNNIGDSMMRQANAQKITDQNPLETGVQVVGQAAGFVNDVIGAGAKKVAPLVPDAVKESFKNSIAQSDIPKIAQAYDTWAKSNPRAAKDLEGIVNIASLLPTGKAAEATASVGTDVVKSASKTTAEVVSKLEPKAGDSLIKAGERIQNIVLKPTAQDIKNGFKIENVTKYDLAGPLDQTLPKATTKLKELKTQLDSTIKSVGNEPTVNIADALNQVKNEFSGKGVKMLGQRSSIDKTIKNIEDELDIILPDWRSKTLSFSDTIDAKRAAGLNAAFLHGQMKNGLTAEEKVWNNFYKILQRETEKVAKDTPFSEINKQISEIIPIEQAMIRRIPIADRNNVISLPELISGIATVSDPRALSIGIANRVLRSPYAAKYLIKAGKALKK